MTPATWYIVAIAGFGALGWSLAALFLLRAAIAEAEAVRWRRRASVGREGEPAFHCVIPHNPIPKARARVTRRGHAYTPQRTRDWEATVAMHARQVWGQREPLRGRLRVRIEFYRKTRRVCDLDNLIKAILDGLEGVVFANDRQIDRFTDTGRAVDRDEPRVEVWVWEIKEEVE